MTSSHHNPDERDLLDFADAIAAGTPLQPDNEIERTYLHVHNTMQGESAAIPPTTKQSTWEDVMSTLAITPDAPVSNRTRRQQSPASSPRSTRPRRLQWTPLASIAAAALVILASFGTWVAMQPEGELPPNAPNVSGIAATGDIAEVAATPNATAVDAVAESTMQSVPIVQMVDEQPMDGPVIWVTTTGEVMYDDGMEVTTIGTNANNVQPQTTNVVKLVLNDPEKDSTDKSGREQQGYTVTYYNLLTGETLVDDGTFSSYLGGPNTFQSPTVLTIADSPGEWSIVNFETMTSASISSLTGGQYRSADPLTVAVSDDFSTIAIGTSIYQSEGSAVLVKQSGASGEVAVIPADLSGASWVSVPEGMHSVNNFLLSPDGSKVAFISTVPSDAGSDVMVSIVDVATNEELVRTDQISSMSTKFQWVRDGNAFVLITENSVQKYTIGESEPTILLESDGMIQQMPRMVGSDMIYLHVSSTSFDGITTPEPANVELVILNPDTGETIRVQGDPWYQGGSSPVTIQVGLSPIPVSEDGVTAKLVHPLTGEVYPDLVANVEDPMMDPDFDPEEGQPIYFLQTVITSWNSPTSVVELADGTLAVFTTSETSFTARVIQRQEGTENLQLNLSMDGRYLTAGNSWGMEEGDSVWVLDLSDENSTWTQLAPNTTIFIAYMQQD